MSKELVARLRELLPIPQNQQDAIITINQANRERRAAATAIEKLLAQATTICPRCDGDGEVQTANHLAAVSCPECKGTGS